MGGPIVGLQNHTSQVRFLLRSPVFHKIFYNQPKVEKVRVYLKDRAYNKAYNPPEDLDFLARDYIQALEKHLDETRNTLILRSKELSSLKKNGQV